MVRLLRKKKKQTPEMYQANIEAKEQLEKEIEELRAEKELVSKDYKDFIESQKDLPSKDKLRKEVIKFGARISEEIELLAHVVDEGFSEEVPCDLVGEDKITYQLSDGTRRTNYIVEYPKIFERKTGWLFKSRKRSLVFYVGRRAECTHDPAKSALDIPTIQMAQSLTIALIENDVIDGIAKAAEPSKQWKEYLPYLFMFLEFVVATVLLSGILENIG